MMLKVFISFHNETNEHKTKQKEANHKKKSEIGKEND